MGSTDGERYDRIDDATAGTAPAGGDAAPDVVINIEALQRHVAEINRLREDPCFTTSRFAIPVEFFLATAAAAYTGSAVGVGLSASSSIAPLSIDAASASAGGLAGIAIFLVLGELLRCAQNKQSFGELRQKLHELADQQEPGEAQDRLRTLAETFDDEALKNALEENGFQMEGRNQLGHGFSKKTFIYFLIAGFLTFSLINFSSVALVGAVGGTAYYLSMTAIKAVLGILLGELSRCAGVPAPIANLLAMLNIGGLNATTAVDFLAKLLPAEIAPWVAPAFAALLCLGGSMLFKGVYELFDACRFATQTKRLEAAGEVGERSALLGGDNSPAVSIIVEHPDDMRDTTDDSIVRSSADSSPHSASRLSQATDIARAAADSFCNIFGKYLRAKPSEARELNEDLEKGLGARNQRR